MGTGPIMLDLQGTEVSAEEFELLRHPNTGGVILYSRNYIDPVQLQALTRKIREVRQPELLIGVDQEGGRIQRFKEHFTRLPPCRKFGELYEQDRRKALKCAELSAWVMASELLCCGVDFSFAPVLDRDTGKSRVIGDRAFHENPDVIAELAKAYIKGMRTAGMAAVGKHFPGHGHVTEDSHVTVPRDRRTFQDIQLSDLIPFERLISAGIAGIMPAHVIFPEIDDKPAGFSRVWLEQILHKLLGFKGAIFSDDISMAGAEVAGSPLERAEAALIAGCDMILVCNDRTAAIDILENLKNEPRPVARVRIMRMYGKFPEMSLAEIQQQQLWKEAVVQIMEIDDTPELDLDDDELHA